MAHAATEATAVPDGGGSAIFEKRNLTLKEAALYLNVSSRTVERLIQRKLLRRNKALRKIFIPRAELDAFLQRTL